MDEVDIALNCMRKAEDRLVHESKEDARKLLEIGIRKVETIQLTRQIVKEELEKQFGST